MSALPTNKLGRTGLEVTKLGYGAMEVRGTRIWGGRPVADDEAGRILNAVLDAGITFIDTANDYGRSEEYIGRFLEKRRDEFVLATKCGCTVVHKDEHTDDTPHVWTRENLFRGLHESLERMKTDHVDLMQLHNPSVEQVESGDLVRALQDMKAQGKVRWIGISTTQPHIETYIGWGVFDAFQIPYSALERQEEDSIQKAHDAGAGVIVRGGVARGEPGAGLGNEDRCKPGSRRSWTSSLTRGRRGRASSSASRTRILGCTRTSSVPRVPSTCRRTSTRRRKVRSRRTCTQRPSGASTKWRRTFRLFLT